MFYNFLIYNNLKIKIYTGCSKEIINNNFQIKKIQKLGNGGNAYIIFDKLIKKIIFYKKKSKFFSEDSHKVKNYKKRSKSGKNLLLRIPFNIFLFNFLNKKILKFKRNKILLLKGEQGNKKKNNNFNLFYKKIFIVFIFKRKKYYLKIKKNLKLIYNFLKLKGIKKYYFLKYFYIYYFCNNIFYLISKFKLLNFNFYNSNILNFYKFKI